jgi:hypothetical protein
LIGEGALKRDKLPEKPEVGGRNIASITAIAFAVLNQGRFPTLQGQQLFKCNVFKQLRPIISVDRRALSGETNALAASPRLAVFPLILSPNAESRSNWPKRFEVC